MRYELMLPYQIRDAIKNNIPVVLPMGVLEYHSEHLAVGMDTLVVVRALEVLETEMDLVLLPPFYYGAASYVVEPAEGNGSIQVDCEELLPFARGLFRSLLNIGFRNIHGVIHHQSENFAAGMPTDLAFKTAAKKVLFDFLQQQRGDGWWGREEMKDYYRQQEQGTDPFHWIQFHSLMDEQMQREYPFDHAGVGETSLMMSLCSEGVDMKKFNKEKWYSRTARDATKEFGDAARDKILIHLRNRLKQ